MPSLDKKPPKPAKKNVKELSLSRENFLSSVASIALRSAAIKGDYAALERALAQGADPLERGKDGHTPLMLVALSDPSHSSPSKDLVRCVRTLAAFGGLDLRDAQGLGSLCLAAKTGDASCLAALIEAGVPLTPDFDGEGPVFWAIRSGGPQCLRLLIKAGAPSDEPNLIGTTPLMLAASEGHDDMMDILLANGAKARRKGPMNQDALMLAAERADASVFNLLLPHSDALALDETGYSALMIATRRGNDDAIVALSASSDVWARTPQGLLALELASKARLPCSAEALRVLALSMMGKRTDMELAAAWARSCGLALGVDNGHESVLEPLIDALIARHALEDSTPSSELLGFARRM